ncbi:hypothetical protein DH2020_006255 [Rehmannia glutinosa]|uniref:DUF4283 domain-containing protein n=1 Tax=Rehmannia glutinosa TaxID=99300 RepID=A0ABR0XIY5_REHGL
MAENQPPKYESYANVTASSSIRSNLSFDPKRVVPVGTHQVRDGKQVLGFSSSENDRLAASWKLTLIGKFSSAIPHPKGIDSGFAALNLKGPFSWRFANPSHIIIKLQLEEDFNKLWMGTLWSLGDCPMRVFKWTPSFNPRTEAPLAPVWIRLPGLPIHFFDHNALFAISNIIGTPLQVDSLTASRSRLSMARVCIELDLLKERTEEILLEFDETSQVQKIIYERVPDYCTHCKHIGHSIVGCYMNGNASHPPPPARQPSSIAGSVGHDLKGLSGFWISQGVQRVKRKGPRETGLISKECLILAKNSKHTYFADTHSYAEGSGTNRFSSLVNGDFQPLDTQSQLIKGSDQVNGFHLDDRIDSIIVEENLVGNVAASRFERTATIRNPNIMGDNSCLQAGPENGISNKKNIDFGKKIDNLAVESELMQDTGNKVGCSIIIFSNKDKLAEEHASRNELIGLENGVRIPPAVNGSPMSISHSTPILSSFEENKNPHKAFAGTFMSTTNCHMGSSFLNDNKIPGSYLEITAVGPQKSSDNMDHLGQNCSSSRHLNMVEIVGDSIINGPDFMTDLTAGVMKGDNCGALFDDNPPELSHSTIPLDGVIAQLDYNRILKGTTTTPFHAKKVEDAKHNLDPDNGPSTPSPRHALCR